MGLNYANRPLGNGLNYANRFLLERCALDILYMGPFYANR